MQEVLLRNHVTYKKTAAKSEERSVPLLALCIVLLNLFADVNECTKHRHNCARDETCVNTDGGFDCVQTCPAGQKMNLQGECVGM